MKTKKNLKTKTKTKIKTRTRTRTKDKDKDKNKDKNKDTEKDRDENLSVTSLCHVMLVLHSPLIQGTSVHCWFDQYSLNSLYELIPSVS